MGDYKDEEVVYLTMKILMMSDERAIAGIVFARRSDGMPLEPYKIGSVFLTEVQTGYQAIYKVLAESLREVETGTKLIVARSHDNRFRRAPKIERKMNVLSDTHFKIIRVTGLPLWIKQQCYELSNDALERKGTIFAEL